MIDVEYWSPAAKMARLAKRCGEQNLKAVRELLANWDPSMPFVLAPPIDISNEALDKQCDFGKCVWEKPIE